MVSSHDEQPWCQVSPYVTYDTCFMVTMCLQYLFKVVNQGQVNSSLSSKDHQRSLKVNGHGTTGTVCEFQMGVL